LSAFLDLVAKIIDGSTDLLLAVKQDLRNEQRSLPGAGKNYARRALYECIQKVLKWIWRTDTVISIVRLQKLPYRRMRGDGVSRVCQ